LKGSLYQRRGEPDRAYFRRLTESIHFRMRYTAARYAVPASENWILHLGSYFIPSFRAYEYADYHRALERGGGQCTQFAAAVFDILKRQGFQRRMVLFPRHTVVAARPRHGPEQILDADFGLVLPHGVAAVTREPELVRSGYAALDPRTTPLPWMSREGLAARLESAYAEGAFSTRSDDPTPQLARVERIAYILKWPLPVAFALAGIVLLAITPRGRSFSVSAASWAELLAGVARRARQPRSSRT
jgi:hypothetical protein